jgi:lipopolysaccharide/colanic/teichoic acid biosynthesis glycosyltransferase
MAMKPPDSSHFAIARDAAADEIGLPPPHIAPAAGEPAVHQDAEQPRLFLAWSENWSDGCETAPGRGDWLWGSAADEPDAPDHGLWLLFGAGPGRRGWLRLAAERLGRAGAHATSSSTYEWAKRAVDVAVASLLLVLAAPLLLLAFLFVWLDSPGPVLFRQKRIGRNRAPFLMWKIRSMYASARRYAPSPSSDSDPRITRIGRILRRASIDELPQLINVLRGEMSLVGPRPEMPFIVENYSPRELGRLAVKPGITGLWQISPARGWPIHENVEYDLHYIRHRNLVLDGAILLRTIAVVIRGLGTV